MTVVIVAKTLTDTTIVADTRVSKADGTYNAENGVLKLIPFQVGEPRGFVVVGFTGYLEPINEILQHVLGTKLYNYKRPFILRVLAQEIKAWIEIFYAKLSYKNRVLIRQCEILLCGYETFRSHQSFHDDPSLSWLANIHPPPGFVYSYKVTRTGKVALNTHGWVYVTGSGRVEYQQIQQLVVEFIAREAYILGSKDFYERSFFKSQMFVQYVLSHFQRANLYSVGAPFQCLYINPEYGIRESFAWKTEGNNWHRRIDDTNVEIYNENDGIQNTYVVSSLPFWINKNGLAGKL